MLQQSGPCNIITITIIISVWRLDPILPKKLKGPGPTSTSGRGVFLVIWPRNYHPSFHFRTPSISIPCGLAGQASSGWEQAFNLTLQANLQKFSCYQTPTPPLSLSLSLTHLPFNLLLQPPHMYVNKFLVKFCPNHLYWKDSRLNKWNGGPIWQRWVRAANQWISCKFLL